MGINEIYTQAINNNAEIIFTKLNTINYICNTDITVLIINESLKELITF